MAATTPTQPLPCGFCNGVDCTTEATLLQCGKLATREWCAEHVIQSLDNNVRQWHVDRQIVSDLSKIINVAFVAVGAQFKCGDETLAFFESLPCAFVNHHHHSTPSPHSPESDRHRSDSLSTSTSSVYGDGNCCTRFQLHLDALRGKLASTFYDESYTIVESDFSDDIEAHTVEAVSSMEKTISPLPEYMEHFGKGLTALRESCTNARSMAMCHSEQRAMLFNETGLLASAAQKCAEFIKDEIKTRGLTKEIKLDKVTIDMHTGIDPCLFCAWLMGVSMVDSTDQPRSLVSAWELALRNELSKSPNVCISRPHCQLRCSSCRQYSKFGITTRKKQATNVESSTFYHPSLNKNILFLRMEGHVTHCRENLVWHTTA
jgi:hypothetical protein